MKKNLILWALVALPLLFACNKSFDVNKKTVNIPTGANISQARTIATPGTPKTNDQGQQETYEGQQVLTRTVFSLNADEDCLSWKEDYVDMTKATSVKIIRKYDFQTGTYSYTTTIKGDNDSVTSIKLTLNEGQDVSIEISSEGETSKVEIVVSHQDDSGKTVIDDTIEMDMNDMDITVPETQDAITINGTWTVKNTIVTARSATFNRDDLDVHAVAEWAKGLGLVEEKDVEETVGYKVTKVVITDSALSINFENGKSFASTLNSASMSSFTIEDFAGKDSDSVKKYFNGNGSFDFSGDLCILSINGEIKGQKDNSVTPITVILTLIKK